MQHVSGFAVGTKHPRQFSLSDVDVVPLCARHLRNVPERLADEWSYWIDSACALLVEGARVSLVSRDDAVLADERADAAQLGRCARNHAAAFPAPNITAHRWKYFQLLVFCSYVVKCAVGCIVE